MPRKLIYDKDLRRAEGRCKQTVTTMPETVVQ